MKKYFVAIVGAAMLTQTTVAQSPTEKAEKRLADLLAPGSVMAQAGPARKMVDWPVARAVEQIDVAIKPALGLPARLALSPLKEVKPRSAPEGTPLVSNRENPSVPEAVQLPSKPLIKLPALDVHTPAPIPILAQPVKDRASLGEPAFEASLDAAMKHFNAIRDKPVPFTPLNLPDPFEHLRYGQLRNPPEENVTPPLIPYTRPK